MQFFRVAEGVPAFFVTVAVEHGHQVEQLAAPQRVVHEVRLLAAPQRDVGAVQMRRHLGHRQHRAVGDVARHARLAVADDLLAHAAPQAVGADQCGGLQPPAVDQLHLDAAVAPGEAGDLALHLQRDRRQFATGVEEHLMQVGAVDHAVGLAVGGQRLLADRRAHHQFAAAHVAHHQVGRKVGDAPDRLGQAQVLEQTKHVGPELDAGADLAQGVGLLEHLHGVALSRQHQRDGQAADAAACDDERRGGHCPRGFSAPRAATSAHPTRRHGRRRATSTGAHATSAPPPGAAARARRRRRSAAAHRCRRRR